MGMALFSNAVRKDGRVTIPAHIREELGIEAGDYVIVGVVPIDGSKKAVEVVNEFKEE